jgi:hypothetical protein
MNHSLRTIATRIFRFWWGANKVMLVFSAGYIVGGIVVATMMIAPQIAHGVIGAIR